MKLQFKFIDSYNTVECILKKNYYLTLRMATNMLKLKEKKKSNKVKSFMLARLKLLDQALLTKHECHECMLNNS